MKPYFEFGGISIYHGDSREILPKLGRFDLLLTDPPYGLGIDGQQGSLRPNGSKLRSAYEFLGWDASPIDESLLRATFEAAEYHVVWGGNYFLPALDIHKGWLVWDKAQYGLTMSDGELAYTNSDRPLRIFNLHRTHLWQEQPQHPTQKPLALMKWCLSLFPEAKSVLDPFMGSGTTLRAAKDAGLTAVGIEREEKYCEIAAKRMAQEVMEFV